MTACYEDLRLEAPACLHDVDNYQAGETKNVPLCTTRTMTRIPFLSWPSRGPFSVAKQTRLEFLLSTNETRKENPRLKNQWRRTWNEIDRSPRYLVNHVDSRGHAVNSEKLWCSFNVSLLGWPTLSPIPTWVQGVYQPDVPSVGRKPAPTYEVPGGTQWLFAKTLTLQTCEELTQRTIVLLTCTAWDVQCDDVWR